MRQDVGENRTASDLCVKCGLCRNGALFDFGPLGDDEKDRVRDAGLTIIEKEGKTAFGLPCPCLKGAFCTVYEDRPQTCRTFRCSTLKALEAEMITYSEAEARIEQGVKALADLQAQLPANATPADARRWRREAGRAEAAKTLSASPMVMMALGLLDQYFRGTDQRQVMPRE